MLARLRRPAVALLSTTLAVSVLGIAPAAHAADGTLSGTVSGPAGPLGGVVVELYRLNAQNDLWQQVYGPGSTAFTAPDGSYAMVVPAGDYRVRFFDTQDVHAFEYHRDADLVEDGQTVSVPASGTVDVDATLELGASVAGTVRGTGADGVKDIAVWAIQRVEDDGYVDYRYAGLTSTDADGDYTFGGLPGGSYLFQYEDGNLEGSPGIYANEYYSDQSNIFEADPFVLDDAEAVTGFDVQLELDAQISGVMTGVDGTALDYAYASALVEVDGRWRTIAYGETDDETGAYVIDGLAAGTYRVEFGAEASGRYLQEYWENTGEVSTATDLVLGIDGSESGVDAELVAGEHDSGEPTVENVTAPVVSGTPQVGSPLTSSAGTWSPDPTLIEYYWVAGNELLQGGTSPTYVPTAADLGKTISVYVYASVDGYDFGWAEALTSGPVVAAPAPPVVAPPVVTPPVVTPPAPPVVDMAAGLAAIVKGLDVAGKRKVGRTVKVTGLDPTLSTTEVSYRFQWFAGTKKIKKATRSRLKITKAVKGKKLSVKVTAKAGSTSTSVKLKAGKVK